MENIRRPSSRPKERAPAPSFPSPRRDSTSSLTHQRYRSDSQLHRHGRQSQNSSPLQRSQNHQSHQRRKGGSNALSNSYELLVNAIIRPPRASYRPQDLGPQNLCLRNNLSMVRRDFQIINRRGQMLVCSRWAPTFEGSRETVCVLYLHGNSSCRMDVLRSGVLNTVATIGYSLVAFDFAGSGLSDGDYVSLGYYEKSDIEDVAQYIIQRGWATKMVLWGRSMGAASALLYTSMELASVTAMVLDSPFSSLTTVAMDLVENSKVGIPGFMVKGFLQFLRMSVNKRAGFDINDLEPIKAAPKCHCPALFLTATNDKMVFPKHGQLLSRAYAGACQRLEFVGTHNSHRPSLALKASAIFLRTAVEAPHKIESAFDTVRQLFGIVTEEFPAYNPMMEPVPRSRGNSTRSFTDFLFGGSQHGPGSNERDSDISDNFSVSSTPVTLARELQNGMQFGPLDPSASQKPSRRSTSTSLQVAKRAGGKSLEMAVENFTSDVEDAVIEELFSRGIAICGLEQWYLQGPDRVADKVVADLEDRILDELLIMGAAHLSIRPEDPDYEMYNSSEPTRQFVLGMKIAEMINSESWGHEEFDCKFWTGLNWSKYEQNALQRLGSNLKRALTTSPQGGVPPQTYRSLSSNAPTANLFHRRQYSTDSASGTNLNIYDSDADYANNNDGNNAAANIRL